MAKPASIKIRLNSTADTGFFYVTKKNARTKTDKLVLKKSDPGEGRLVAIIAALLLVSVAGTAMVLFGRRNAGP